MSEYYCKSCDKQVGYKSRGFLFALAWPLTAMFMKKKCPICESEIEPVGGKKPMNKLVKYSGISLVIIIVLAAIFGEPSPESIEKDKIAKKVVDNYLFTIKNNESGSNMIKSIFSKNEIKTVYTDLFNCIKPKISNDESLLIIKNNEYLLSFHVDNTSEEDQKKIDHYLKKPEFVKLMKVLTDSVYKCMTSLSGLSDREFLIATACANNQGLKSSFKTNNGQTQIECNDGQRKVSRF